MPLAELAIAVAVLWVMVDIAIVFALVTSADRRARLRRPQRPPDYRGLHLVGTRPPTAPPARTRASA